MHLKHRYLRETARSLQFQSAVDFTILSGTANPELAFAIAKELHSSVGECTITRFPDGEVSIDLREPVRRREVFIIQPTSPPVDEHLIELLALADACRRASAGGITAVVPYFGYSRSDKRHGRHEPITASMVADLMQTVGIQHVLTIDLHALQIEGFFRIPVDSLSGVSILSHAMSAVLAEGTVLVSPDAGRVKMATEYAHRLGTPLTVLHKRRETGADATITHVVGDVKDRPCLIIDDMISTGGTIVEAVTALLDAGAKPEITVAATHGLFLDDAPEKLDLPSVRRIFTTDTIKRDQYPANWHIVSVAPLLADAIRRSMSKGPRGELPNGAP
jgi:ribose-phosphate pyrophosphokinase